MRKKWMGLIAAAVMLLNLYPVQVSAAKYEVVSTAAIVMDADTGEILYRKNEQTKLYPASITKILTALIAVESCGMDEMMQVGADAVRIPNGYAHLALTSGDTIRADDAMYALMLASANDAANVIADHIGGSQAAFAKQMNARAKELGVKNSNFVNPHGIPSKQHYTTAQDMALILAGACKNQQFMQYFGATSHTLPAFNSNTKSVRISAHQFMLLPEKAEYYPDAIGGKIGYTRVSGHTMCTVAKRDGRTLVCVVLGSTKNGKYKDTQVLLDNCFNR